MKIFLFLILTILTKWINGLNHEIAIVDNFLEMGKFRKTMKYLERYYYNTHTKIRLPGGKRAICYSPIDPLVPKKELEQAEKSSDEERLKILKSVLKGYCSIHDAESGFKYTICPGFYTKAVHEKEKIPIYIGIDSHISEIFNQSEMFPQNEIFPNLQKKIDDKEMHYLQTNQSEKILKNHKSEAVKKRIVIKEELQAFVSKNLAMISNPRLLKKYKMTDFYGIRFSNSSFNKVQITANIDLFWNEGLIKFSNIEMNKKLNESKIWKFEKVEIFQKGPVRGMKEMIEKRGFYSDFIKAQLGIHSKNGDIMISKVIFFLKE